MSKNAESLEPLDQEQLAKRWKITLRTLQIWRRKGIGPKYFKLRDVPRGLIRYRMEDILAFEREKSK